MALADYPFPSGSVRDIYDEIMRKKSIKRLWLWGFLVALILALAIRPGSGWRSAAGADVDHFLLALTWSPSWCALRKDPDHPQCDPARDLGWVVHGLWPQWQEGWPEWCSTEETPSTADLSKMADVMPTRSLANYQWRKHGSCTGWGPGAYANATLKASARVNRPQLNAGEWTAAEILQALQSANPGTPEDSFNIICRNSLVYEIRICLDRALHPISCPQSPHMRCTGENTLPSVL